MWIASFFELSSGGFAAELDHTDQLRDCDIGEFLTQLSGDQSSRQT